MPILYIAPIFLLTQKADCDMVNMLGKYVLFLFFCQDVQAAYPLFVNIHMDSGEKGAEIGFAVNWSFSLPVI